MHASFCANVMIVKRLHSSPPRERCLKTLFAFLAFLCALISCVSLFGVGDYSPLEKIRVITSANSPFRLPQPQPFKPTLKNDMLSKISRGENQFNNYNFSKRGSRSQIPKMCTDIFSIGKTRSTMTPFAKTIVSYLRRVKYSRKSRPFLRHEPYILLGDMMPVMFNTTTLGDNVTKVEFNKVGRMEQVAGLFPHLSCQLRDYTTEMLKQCLVNRRRRGKATKLFFMGDSRVRQFVEVFLDVFRDMDFEITTHEGIVVSVDDFLSPDVSVLWMKYKKTFVARSKLVQNFEIEFYWTTIFNLKVKNIHTENEIQTQDMTEAQAYLKSEDIASGKQNNTHAFFHKAFEEMRQEAIPEKILSVSTTGKSLLNRSSTDVDDAHPDQTNSGDRYNISPVLSNMDSIGNLMTPLRVNAIGNISSSAEIVRPTKRSSFKSKPLEKLKNLLTLTSTKIPDIVILGTSIWGVDNFEPILHILDEITIRQVAQLRPLLLRLSAVTQLVWVMPSPVKDHMYPANLPMVHHTNVFMRHIEWIASAQVQLMAQGITVWDSFFPIAIASVNDCVEAYLHGNVELPPNPKLGLVRSWACGDRLHNNNEAFVVAVQMLANQLCNEYMPHEGYCCEK